MTRTLLPVLTLATIVATGCMDTPSDEYEPEKIDPAGSHYHYVVDSLHFPTSATEANALGANLDGDERGRRDNAFGQVLAYLAGAAEFDLDVETRTLIDSGEILHLLDVQTTSLDRASGVGVTVLHANDTDSDATDNFSGREVFGVDTALGQGTLSGFVNAGVINVELGDVPLAVTFPGLDQRFIVNLSHTTINAAITADGMAGYIGGAISKREYNETILPLLHAGLSRIVGRDCPAGQCVLGSFGETVMQTFDTDHDGALAYTELSDSSIVRSLLAPDLDLYDDNGERCIRCDGVKESLSIGVGFTALPAVIER